MISILYVSNTEKMSGAEFSLLSLMRGLDRKQFQPLLLLPGEGLFAECARKAGIELQIVPFMVRFGEAFRPRVLPRVAACVWQVRRIIRRRRIRIVHANSPRAAYIGALAGRLAGAFTLTHVRDIEQSPFGSRAKSRLLGFLSDRIVAVSQATADAILAVNPALRGKVKVVYNGIEREAITVRPAAETRGRLGISTAVKLIGSAGILHAAKGQDILIRAAVRLRAEYPELKVLLIGQVFHANDAEYEKKLEKLVVELGIKGSIVFTGFRNDVCDLIQAMDVFVHPAVFQDPLPRILLEAAACGRPIVATKTGGIPEIIQDGISGLLVEPGNADALADAVLALLRHPDKAMRLGQEAMKRIEQTFSLRRHISAITAIYRQFASKGG